MSQDRQYELAKQVKERCIDTALSAYESASISGLCGEGAFEAAISAIRMLDLREIIESDGPQSEGDPGA